jgi:hypothetical protein
VSINLTNLFRQAVELDIERRRAEEIPKLGILRGGNSGLLLPGTRDGDWMVAGTCHRKALLRAVGVSETADLSRQVMFSGGFANEDIWVQRLSTSWPGVILKEEEVPISWTTENGRQVTGRPDIVLCDSERQPQLGIELKMVASKWTAKDVFYSGKPKFGHLIQAGHYMWQLGIPWRLAYTQYVDFHIGVTDPWEGSLYPKEGEPGSETIEYGTYENKKTGKSKRVPKKLLPRIQVYELRLNSEGYLEYRPESESGRERWVTTVIETSGISDFYHYMADLLENKQLGSRPVNIDVNGEKLRWSMCDRMYCIYSETCDRHESNYEKWLAEATAVAASSRGGGD